MISIIIPVYNKESEIKKALLAIENQTINDYEIIIVNDGSTDNSLNVIENYFKEKKEIRHKIINKINEGVSVARNKGIDASIGDYIFFMDGDDKIEDNCLEILLKNIEKEEIDFSVTGYEVIQNDKVVNTNRFLETRSYDNKDFLKLFILSKVNIYMGNALYKSSIIKSNKLRFDYKYKYNEDQVFIYKYLMSCNKVFFTEEKLFTYFRGDSSVTMKATKERLTDVNIFVEFRKWLSEKSNENKEIITLINEYKIPYSILIGCSNLAELNYGKNEFVNLIKENKELFNELSNFNIKYGRKAFLKIALLRFNKKIFYSYIKN